MYELVKVSDHDYYIDCPAKMGLVLISQDEVVAIDSGLDKDAAKKLLRHVEENGWKLKAVFNTHSHADHVGGNFFLQEKTGCHIYTSGLETVYANNPELESMTLFGGLPFKDISGKFLKAQKSHVEPISDEVLPPGMEIISFPGHSFDMIGFKTFDENIFLADSLCSEDTLAKYGITYLWDAGKYLETLEKIKTLKAVKFIPSHAPVCDDIIALADKNIEAVNRLLEKIIFICKKTEVFENILHELMVSFGMQMNIQQYALTGSTIRSCLSYLYTIGKLQIVCEDSYMKWTSAF